MKTIFRVGLVVAALALAAVPAARADIGTYDFGVTNKFASASVTTANMGSTNGFKIDKQADVGLVCQFQGDATGGTGTSNLTLCVARSADGVVWETTPCFNWVIPINGNTAVVAYTNLNKDIIGSAGYIKITQATVSGAANLTNASVQAIIKTIKAAASIDVPARGNGPVVALVTSGPMVGAHGYPSMDIDLWRETMFITAEKLSQKDGVRKILKSRKEYPI